MVETKKGIAGGAWVCASAGANAELHAVLEGLLSGTGIPGDVSSVVPGWTTAEDPILLLAILRHTEAEFVGVHHLHSTKVYPAIFAGRWTMDGAIQDPGWMRCHVRWRGRSFDFCGTADASAAQQLRDTLPAPTIGDLVG